MLRGALWLQNEINLETEKVNERDAINWQNGGVMYNCPKTWTFNNINV